MSNRMFETMECGDARHLHRIVALKKQPARTIITSPPYLDMQDYGVADQIGHGQSKETYLADLKQIFEQCLNLSTHDSTMWLVVGAVRRSGRLIQLPEIVTRVAAEVGWIPREQLTWAKEKSLPWTGLGEFRDVTEQVILLSKSEKYLFDLSDLLSPDPASPWWLRYPERYSPKGRKPTNLWNIRIPTQGSWKNGPVHLCPFPHELTFRMVSLTSEPGDVVFDPFAGIGSVPAMAEAMGRIGVGLELSEEYVNAFSETLRQTREWLEWKTCEIEKSKPRQELFHDTIIMLRLLKYGRLIGKYLVANDIFPEWIHVSRSQIQADEKFKIVVGNFEIKVAEQDLRFPILQILQDCSKTRPLSKFGVQPVFHITDKEWLSPPEYWYAGGKFWSEPMLEKPKSSSFHLSSDFRPMIEEFLEQEDIPTQPTLFEGVSDIEAEIF